MWIWELLVVGSVWFYVFLSALIIWCTALVENTKWGWATVSILAGFGALALFGNFNVFKLVLINPMVSLYVLGAYFAIGAIWSVIKWWTFCKNLIRKCRDEQKSWLKSHGYSSVDEIPDSELIGFKDIMRYKDPGPPESDRHAETIMTWIAFWPLSLTWTAINDPLRRVVVFIFDQLTSVYDRISNLVWRDLREDTELVNNRLIRISDEKKRNEYSK